MHFYVQRYRTSMEHSKERRKATEVGDLRTMSWEVSRPLIRQPWLRQAQIWVHWEVVAMNQNLWCQSLGSCNLKQASKVMLGHWKICEPSVQCVYVQLLSRERLWDHTDYSPPGSSVHGIFPARTLERVAIFLLQVTFPAQDRTSVSCVSCIGRWILYH